MVMSEREIKGKRERVGEEDIEVGGIRERKTKETGSYA